MTKKDQILKMSIIAIIVFSVVTFLTIPSLSKILWYYFCDEVEDIHSQALEEDKTVKVPFDCVISIFDIKSTHYTKYFSENYYLLRIGADQYVCVHIPTADTKFWKGVTLYHNPSEALVFNGEKKFALIGKVETFSAEEKEHLLNTVNANALQDYTKMINGEMTNPDIYVDLIYIDRELIFVAIESVVLLVFVILFLKVFRKYKEMKTEEEL